MSMVIEIGAGVLIAIAATFCAGWLDRRAQRRRQAQVYSAAIHFERDEAISATR